MVRIPPPSDRYRPDNAFERLQSRFSEPVAPARRLDTAAIGLTTCPCSTAVGQLTKGCSQSVVGEEGVALGEIPNLVPQVPQ